MLTIKDMLKTYYKKLDCLDLELLIANTLKKSREFVIAHPEYQISPPRVENLKLKISRRMKGEPIAYILGHKEFFGLDFKVNRHTLVPRPETELLVEEVLKLKPKNTTIIDVGTGSGNIIISLVKNMKAKNKFFAVDISADAVRMGRLNSRLHDTSEKIKFLRGNLLDPFFKANKLASLETDELIIVANLPYLSKNIYNSAGRDIKKYEPRSALLSGKNGLAHYERLLEQVKILKNQHSMLRVTCFMEISPEQKKSLQKIIQSHLPRAKTSFSKDLSGRWRLGQVSPD